MGCGYRGNGTEALCRQRVVRVLLKPTRMDLYDTKSRIAEAFVESIFRRARYQVRPFGASEFALRFGREHFSPNFVACVSEPPESEFLVEVKYRPSVEQFIALENQRGPSSIFVLARRTWPTLYFVLVTDRPGPGRSCFQALAFTGPGTPFRTVDLVELHELKIYEQNVEEHEQLLLSIFGLLTKN